MSKESSTAPKNAAEQADRANQGGQTGPHEPASAAPFATRDEDDFIVTMAAEYGPEAAEAVRAYVRSLPSAEQACYTKADMEAACELAISAVRRELEQAKRDLETERETMLHWQRRAQSLPSSIAASTPEPVRRWADSLKNACEMKDRRHPDNPAGFSFYATWSMWEAVADALLSPQSAIRAPEKADPMTLYINGGCTENECRLCNTRPELRNRSQRHAGIPSYPHPTDRTTRGE